MLDEQAKSTLEDLARRCGVNIEVTKPGTSPSEWKWTFSADRYPQSHADGPAVRRSEGR